MRRFLIAVLLSGAAASPALAQDWNDHGHHQQNNGRVQPQQQQRDQGHADRGNGGNFYRQQAPQFDHQQAPQFVRQQAPQFVRQAPQFVRQQPVQVEQGQRGAWGGQRFDGRAPGQARVEEGQRGAWGGQRLEGRPPGQVLVRQQAYRGGVNGQVAQPEQVHNWNGGRNWTGSSGDYRQGQVVPQYRDGDRYAHNDWDRDWRNDRRYDWRHYRDHHRSLFHIGLYYDPFGYGYQPFDIGFQLAPVYFGDQYWIDPAMYELPYPPPGTQWVRYWNDAVLVDIYSGEVVDVIHDFFW